MTKKQPEVWKPPTRRSFVAMLGLGAAALAVKRSPRAETDPAPVPRTLWIGHC